MTKGSKIWLWILMIAGGFSAIAGLAAMKYSAGIGILTVTNSDKNLLPRRAEKKRR